MDALPSQLSSLEDNGCRYPVDISSNVTKDLERVNMGVRNCDSSEVFIANSLCSCRIRC